MQQHINLNLIPTGLPPIFYASAYDVGRVFTISVYEGSELYTIPDGAEVELHALKPDKKALDYKCTVSGSTVSFTATEQMTAVSGIVDCKIWISKDGNRLGTLRFRLFVDADALPDDADMSASDLSAIQQDIDIAKDARDKAKTYADSASTSADAAAESAKQAEIAADSKTAFQYYYGMLNQTIGFKYGDDGNVSEIDKTDNTFSNTCVTTFTYSDNSVIKIVSTVTTKELKKYIRTLTFAYSDDGNVSDITCTYTEEDS